jgi:hypothetical protein
MNPSVNQRVSPNRVALILALLLAAWLVFEFYPRKKPAPSFPPVAAESKLHAVGLADNPDWDGLPEFFALWADHAEWKDGRTRFAYWHPVMKTYSYYFEATRSGEGVRFREIAEPHDPDHDWDENTSDDLPIRFYHSIGLLQPERLPASISVDLGPREPVKVKLNVAAPGSLSPKTEIIPVVPEAKP